MKGINIWNAETFERRTRGQQAQFPMPIPITLKPDPLNQSKLLETYWVKCRPVGFFSLKHRLHCALEVFRGKADIIYFHKQ